jgi:hypothetical protein
MGFHGWLATILGFVFTVIVGCGLMGLMFYSSRYGYDDEAHDLSDGNKDD